MNQLISKSQRGKAYYNNSIRGFLKESTDSIVGKLVRNSFEISKEQSDAWENQIKELKRILQNFNKQGYIIFEYDIVRLGKRVDIILLINNIVFSLEFKNGKKVFTPEDAKQAEDYAIDIKNFHKESEALYVCPILIATNAKPYTKPQSLDCYPDKQLYLQRENIETLMPKINEILSLYGNEREFIDFNKWYNSPYCPTPTIISAAIEAYNTHDITEIARSEAGQDEVNDCEEKINEIINYAYKNKRKCICFVTGVPGAGKTLVGLDVVTKNLKAGKEKLSVYISGNGPLVDVLREALKRSVREKHKKTKETDASINALIQSSFSFKNYNLIHEQATAEKIMVFDEAQRVWNKEKMTRKHKDINLAVSEPHLLYSIMDRQDDWAVIICLAGLGQDIYDGEVGLNEWFKCGIDEFENWELFYSSDIFSQTEDLNISRKMIENCNRCFEVKELHLKTSVRSFRANKLSQFIDYLLNNEPENAKCVFDNYLDRYPIYVSRDYKAARKWAHNQVRGSQRCGVMASSSAQRLKPEGVYVSKNIDVKNWFLAPTEDLRSSNKMEIVASEFKVQGLEIDWGVICWDADLRRSDTNDSWDYYTFKGTKWYSRRKEELKRYLVNSYRVLLTRARQGMVIFVPDGVESEEDITRNKMYYDNIYAYLKSCGVNDLELEL